MTSKRLSVLITNDDGISAAGIRHLSRAMASIADITIVAPAHEQSASSVGITLRSPLRLQKVEWENDTPAWSVTGTPADCVKLALAAVLADHPPDLIVSGINRGNNAGRNFFYSGTVAAVIEGVLHDIPGVAFSCWDYVHTNYQLAEKCIPHLIQHVIEHPLPPGTFLNVNFPSTQILPFKGLKMAKHGRALWMENPDKRAHPDEGHDYYWLGSRLVQFEENEESDIFLLEQGYATVVPIKISELTDHHQIDQRKAHLESLFEAENLKSHDF